MEIKKGTIQTSHEKINTSATTFVRQEPIVKEFTGKQPATNELRPSIGKIAKEPIVRAINSIVINNKKLVNCEIDNGILKMDWDQPDWTIDDIKNWKKEVETHFRVIDYDYDSLMLNIFKNQPIEAIIVPSKFKIQINPAGGIECFYSRISAKSSVNLGPFSYKLERKKNLGRSRPKLLGGRVTRPAIQQDSTLQSAPQVDIPQGFSPPDSENEYGWKTIAEEKNNVYGFFIYDDKDIEENQSYTYRLTVKDSSTKDTTEYEETILYKRLNIEIIKFEAIPDPLEKKIVLTHQVENSLSVKIYRNGKEIGLIKEDHDVELNGKYEYVLEASNAWETITKTISVTCSNSLLPQRMNINYEVDPFEKWVTLKWQAITNAKKIIIEHRLQNESAWKKIREQDSSTNTYTDKNLDHQQSSKFMYRVSWYNGWGSSYSEIQIEKTQSIPKKPRLRSPMICWDDQINNQPGTIRWIGSKDALAYEVKRYNNSNNIDFQKIDRDEVECNKKWQIKAPQNIIRDNSITKGVQYLYKITAKNEWNDSEPCYFDLKIRNEFNGTPSKETPFHRPKSNCVVHVEKEWTDDFQGITTDGKYWYLTNGAPGTKHVKLRKWPITENLDENIGFVYNAPSKYNHFGDLDCYKNYLFIPVFFKNEYTFLEDYDFKSEIWIFNKENMERIKTVRLYREPNIESIILLDELWTKLKKETSVVKFADILKKILDIEDKICIKNIGWCAFNPHDGRLYTSSNYINEESPIYSYDLNLNNLNPFFDENPSLDYRIRVNKTVRKLNLYDASGKHFETSGMQGGCFDYYNNLYLSSGYKDSKNPGIHVFKLIRNENQEIMETTFNANSNETNAELYERYISGDWNRHFCNSKGILVTESTKEKGYFQYNLDTSKYEGLKDEAEGIVYYDFAHKVRKPYHDKIKKTSLHASMLHNQNLLLRSDAVSLINYLHTFRDTEEKNIYYNPSNLKVTNDQDQGDYKIVDNGILVKRLRTKLQADCAIKVLNHFKRIHIIGWLHTTSPDHNYEFSALELTEGSIVNQLTTWINTLEDEQKKAVNLTVIQYDKKNLEKNYDPKQDQEIERYIIYFIDKKGDKYHFCAHNKQDADSIYGILYQYEKICIIGEGSSILSYKYGSDINYGHQIYSANNLIWLEEKVHKST